MIKYTETVIESNITNYDTPTRIEFEFDPLFRGHVLAAVNAVGPFASIELNRDALKLVKFTCIDDEGLEFEPSFYEYELESVVVNNADKNFISAVHGDDNLIIIMFTTTLEGTQQFWVSFPKSVLG